MSPVNNVVNFIESLQKLEALIWPTSIYSISSPRLVITAVVPLTTKSELTSNIDITFLIPLAHLTDPLNAFFIAFPRRTAVYTLYLSGFARSPLLETLLVNIISTGSLAPNNLFCLRFKFHDTDWTIAFDWFAVVRG
jgi:hypothetical protein